MNQNGTVSYCPSDYGNFIGFTGRYHDWETGLVYFRARYYDTGLGRFIGRDPKEYINGMGLYGAYYVPNGLDPLGKDDESTTHPGPIYKPGTEPLPGFHDPNGQYSNASNTTYEPETTTIANGLIPTGTVYNQLNNGVPNGLQFYPATQSTSDEEVLANLLSMMLILTPAGEAGIIGQLEKCPIALSKGARLNLLYNQLDSGLQAQSAQDAMNQLNQFLNGIEEKYSGVEFNPNPGLNDTGGRMYPPFPDRVIYNPDGSITAYTKGSIINYSPTGGVTITNYSGGVIYKNP